MVSLRRARAEQALAWLGQESCQPPLGLRGVAGSRRLALRFIAHREQPRRHVEQPRRDCLRACLPGIHRRLISTRNHTNFEYGLPKKQFKSPDQPLPDNSLRNDDAGVASSCLRSHESVRKAQKENQGLRIVLVEKGCSRSVMLTAVASEVNAC